MLGAVTLIQAKLFLTVTNKRRAIFLLKCRGISGKRNQEGDQNKTNWPTQTGKCVSVDYQLALPVIG